MYFCDYSLFVTRRLNRICFQSRELHRSQRNTTQGNTIQGRGKSSGKIECLWGLDSLVPLFGQGAIIAWDRSLLTRFEDLLSGAKRASSILRVCQELIQARRVKPERVCMRTYSTTSAAALDRIDMFGTRLLRLRIRRTSTRQYTLLETESPRARARARERRRALCKLSGLPGVSIIAARPIYLPFAPFNRIRKNSIAYLQPR